jgi:hypothetical protein
MKWTEPPRTHPTLMFMGPFLLDPPPGWRVEWTDDVVGTLVHLELPDAPHRVWRLTGKREYGDGVIHYEGVWPD